MTRPLERLRRLRRKMERDDPHDPLQVFRRRVEAAERTYEEAEAYLELGAHAEKLAIEKARRGDRHGAYDDALDARWAMEHVAVRVCAWLAGGAP